MRLVKAGAGLLVPSSVDQQIVAAALLRRRSPTQCWPQHYRALAEDVWHALGWTPPDDLHARKAAERLRCSARDRLAGLDYVERPHCLVFLQEWFAPLDQLALFAAADASLVVPRWDDVGEWFRGRWPRAWRASVHADFELHLDDVFTVSVAEPNGPRAAHEYGGQPTTRLADVHLLGRATSDGRWAIVGWCEGDRFERGVSADAAWPMPRMYAHLNGWTNGLDLNALRRAATTAWQERSDSTLSGQPQTRRPPAGQGWLDLGAVKR